MSTYDEIMRKRKGELKARVTNPDEIAGIRCDTTSVCPQCEHKFPVTVIVRQVGLVLLSPKYGKRGEVELNA
ncbi:hypothetical protein KAR91_45835 [Candidatus Pacearchaeota archaeon]|nr:hypothetical protein [Candidatus Pacearchaeota archaeon]